MWELSTMELSIRRLDQQIRTSITTLTSNLVLRARTAEDAVDTTLTTARAVTEAVPTITEVAHKERKPVQVTSKIYLLKETPLFPNSTIPTDPTTTRASRTAGTGSLFTSSMGSSPAPTAPKIAGSVIGSVAGVALFVVAIIYVVTRWHVHSRDIRVQNSSDEEASAGENLTEGNTETSRSFTAPKHWSLYPWRGTQNNKPVRPTSISWPLTVKHTSGNSGYLRASSSALNYGTIAPSNPHDREAEIIVSLETTEMVRTAHRFHESNTAGSLHRRSLVERDRMAQLVAESRPISRSRFTETSSL